MSTSLAVRRSLVWVGLAAVSLVGACSSGAGSADAETMGSAGSADIATTSEAASASSDSAPADERPLPLRVELAGEAEVVFDWSADACSSGGLPDLPTRIYRGADDTVNLILSSPAVHRMVGPEFDSLVVDCDPIWISPENPDPAQYRFREWLGALWTADGETIHAVVHNEYHGDEGARVDSSRDFGPRSADRGWSYLGLSDAGEVELIDNGSEWRAEGSNCLVAAWGAHPDSWCRSIRRWTAPFSAEVSIYVEVADAGVGGGNGVDVGIAHEQVDVWTATIEEASTATVEAEIFLTVDTGDVVDFWVDARGDASFDATAFWIEINEDARRCPSQIRDQCLMTALTHAQSEDGGDSFSTAEPRGHLVAAVPHRYGPDLGRVGYWQPSNIVRHPSDGYWYMMTQVDIHEEGLDVTGVCVLRTDDLSDPQSWRAWDGKAFDHAFTDPYADREGESTPERSICRSVVEPPAWSLSWNTYLERFVLLTEVPSLDPPGVYLRTSTDLIDWSAATLVLETEIGFANGFQPPFEAYPSLVDHDSPSRSFDTSGREPHLYFTRINGYDPLDFDLLRIPIRLGQEP